MAKERSGSEKRSGRNKRTDTFEFSLLLFSFLSFSFGKLSVFQETVCGCGGCAAVSLLLLCVGAFLLLLVVRLLLLESVFVRLRLHRLEDAVDTQQTPFVHARVGEVLQI